MIPSLAAKGKILPLSAVINSLKRSRSLRRCRGLTAASSPRSWRSRCLRMAVSYLPSCYLTRTYRSRDPSEGPREIPVEVVTEPPPPPPAPKPAAPQAGEKSTAPHEATQAPSSEPHQKPETAANPKPANEAMSGPHPVETSAAQQKPVTQQNLLRGKNPQTAGQAHPASQPIKTPQKMRSRRNILRRQSQRVARRARMEEAKTVGGATRLDAPLRYGTGSFSRRRRAFAKRKRRGIDEL